MQKLPDFTFHSYKLLLEELRGAGYDFNLVKHMPLWDGKQTAYLRHDIDFHLIGLEKFAILEAEMGISSTFFVLLSEHYNILHPTNRRVLNTLIQLGHDVGLHYDLTTYPTNQDEANNHLEWEANLLSEVIGRPVCAITTHQPFRDLPDPFRSHYRFIHSHDPRNAQSLTYISESARAWRDENILLCFSSNPPKRLLLTTHLEFWMGAENQQREIYADRMMYDTMIALSSQSLHSQKQIWSQHPGVKFYDLYLSH
jgi:hypothetical protein